ncbi:MAG: PAS domain S-box protein, partial [Candidatus Thermoplasmatota archaeon]|nr:PAS domain S-box protein [Candidatus Thermoplasmatota archaeon]
MKILYVDDDEGKREEAKTFLESAMDDFKVDTASSVKSGMDKLEDDDYDVIVSDYKMTPKDGLDFLEELHGLGKNVPFIMLTAKEKEEVAKKALNSGADRYIRRQDDPKNLYEFLSRVIIQEFEHYDEKRERRLHETYFQDLFESSPEGIVLLDSDDRIIKANESFEKIFQYDIEDIKGEKINDLIVPDDKRDKASSASKNVLSGDSIRMETQRERKDGGMVDVSILGYPIKFEGEQIGVFGIYRDITDRKKRERKIKNLYHALSKMGTCDSEDEVYDFVLDSAKEILNFKSSSIMIAERDYLVTKKVIAENVEVGDKEPIDEGIRGLTYQNKKSYLIEDLDERKEAKPTDPDFQSVISIPIGEEGVFQALSYQKGYFDEFDLEMAEGLVFHMEKILEIIKSRRELQKSEEKYRAIFECAGDAIFVIKDFELVDCNRRTEEIFKIEKEDVLGHNPWEFAPKEQPDGKNSKKYGKKMIEEALAGESKFFEWVLETFDGRKLYTEVSLNKYEIDEEEYVMAVVRDVTERKEAERKLEKRNEKIKKLHEKAMDLERCESEEEICELVIETSEEILDFYAGSIDFVEDGEFEVKATIRGVQEKGTTYPIEGVAGKTFRKGKSFLNRNLDEEEDAVPKRESYRSAISIPFGDIGVFQALSEEKDDFDEKDLELAEILVNHASEAINRLRSEKEVRRNKRRYETLFEENPEAIVEVDEDFKIVAANEQFQDLFNYKEKEIRGKYVKDLIVPENKHEEAEKLDEKSKEGYFEHETVRLTKDGEEVHVAITGRPIKQEGKIHHLAVYRDISERKKVEKELERRNEKIRNLHDKAMEFERSEGEEDICELVIETSEEIL